MLFNVKGCLNQRGFTLIELVTVMAIISILAVIAIGKYSDATATANTAKIASDLSTIDSDRKRILYSIASKIAIFSSFDLASFLIFLCISLKILCNVLFILLVNSLIIIFLFIYLIFLT